MRGMDKTAAETKCSIPVHCPVEFLAKTNITDKRAAKWGFVEQNYEKGENICS